MRDKYFSSIFMFYEERVKCFIPQWQTRRNIIYIQARTLTLFICKYQNTESSLNMLLYTSLIYYHYIHYNLQYIRFNAFLTVIFVKKRFSMLNFSNTSFAIRVSSLHIFANIIASVAVAVINRYSQCAFNRRNDIYDYYIDSRGFTNTVTRVANIVARHLGKSKL